eukprot:17869-Heterococcus_DN1.PRE.4
MSAQWHADHCVMCLSIVYGTRCTFLERCVVPRSASIVLVLMYPPHLIVELHTHAAKGLAQRLTSSSSGSSSSTVTADGDSSNSVSTEGWNWSAVDYFLPEDLDSGVLVQVALEPDLSYAFEELLRPDAGFEIYMRDIADYGYASSSSTANTVDKLHSSSSGSSEVVGEATFLELAARAEAQGHVAIGIDRARTDSSSSGSSEREQILCPDKRTQYTLRKGDRLIVLATYTQK